MKNPPSPTEICKRRGFTLAPIITKCFDETMSSEEFPQVTRIHVPIYPGARRDKYHEREPGNREISRWSSTTEDSSSAYSEPESDFDYEESYEEKLERHRRFFDNRPLMRCMDDDNDQLLADLLFERLLREVQQPGLPFEESNREARGEIQVRAFWDGIRQQLQVDESFLKEEWRERLPQSGLQTYLSSRGWRSTGIFEGESDRISRSQGLMAGYT